MKNFNDSRRPSSSGGGFAKRSFGGGNRFGGGGGGRGFGGGRDGGRPSMHQAICSDCGRSCEVPFRPTGDKPVYCSDCFGGNSKPAGNKFGRDSFSRGPSNSRFEEKRMYSATCAECGNDCEVPFKPTGEKPVLCSHCFAGSGDKPMSFASKPFKSPAAPGNDKMEMLMKKMDEMKAQMDKMASRLDKVLKDEAPIFSQKEMAKAEPKADKMAFPKGKLKAAPVKMEKVAEKEAPKKEVKPAAKIPAPAKKAPVKKAVAKAPAKKAVTKKKK